jgi:hypothetical protein
MMAGMRILCSIACALGSVFAPPVVEAEASEFESRWKLAEENRHTDAGHEYITRVFFGEFNAKFFVHINECTQQTGERMATDRFRAVLELSSSGSVLSAVVETSSRPAECFAEAVKKDAFSKPPADHYLVPIDIRFSAP